MLKFLFQGDSITDANRRRDDENNYGYGYPNLFAADYMHRFPGKWEFRNEGISGDKIVDLYARIKCDIINLAPDYMSVLVGVNDVWHELNEQDGVSAEKYEKVYTMLIEEVFAALPHIKIFILEPFVLKGPGTERYYDVFREEVEKRSAAAKRIAEKFNLTFVPLQAEFDKACESAEPTYWLADGVHPTAAGHALIKAELSKAVGN